MTWCRCLCIIRYVCKVIMRAGDYLSRNACWENVEWGDHAGGRAHLQLLPPFEDEDVHRLPGSQNEMSHTQHALVQTYTLSSRRTRGSFTSL